MFILLSFLQFTSSRLQNRVMMWNWENNTFVNTKAVKEIEKYFITHCNIYHVFISNWFIIKLSFIYLIESLLSMLFKIYMFVKVVTYSLILLITWNVFWSLYTFYVELYINNILLYTPLKCVLISSNLWVCISSPNTFYWIFFFWKI